FDAHTRPALFGALPAWQRTLLPGPLRKRVAASARAHGMGRHSPEEVGQIGVSDYRCLAETLGDRAFLFGDVPTTIDASAYAFITAVSGTPFDTPMRDYVAQSGLVDYANRFAAHAGLA
ncbi:MAG: glutathione S-transferase C-terminal domain-containing protein, partial [Pseudomonadota bacterium]